MEKDNKEKHLYITIPHELHKRIKMGAIERCLSIKDWVIEAIATKIMEEDKYK